MIFKFDANKTEIVQLIKMFNDWILVNVIGFKSSVSKTQKLLKEIMNKNVKWLNIIGYMKLKKKSNRLINTNVKLIEY